MRRVFVKLAVVAVVLVAGVGGVVAYVAHQQNATRAALLATIEQEQRVSDKQGAIDQREARILDLRIKAERDGGANSDDFLNAITDNGKLGVRRAIQNDPIVAPVASDHPEVVALLQAGDATRLDDFLRTVPEDRLSSSDRAYVRQFGRALTGWRD